MISSQSATRSLSGTSGSITSLSLGIQIPSSHNGELRVPAKDYSSIAKYCFETEQEATNQAMKCCGSGIVDFGDGTLMITAFPKGDPRIFSPRLSAKRLEEFCKKNSKKYTEFYSNNRDLIDDGYLASMERFW